MSSEILSCQKSTTVEEALKMMINNRITGMPVVDESGKMIGMISETDMIHMFAKVGNPTAEFFASPIEFREKFTSIKSTTGLAEIMETFISTRTRRLPVIDDDNRLVGIVSKRDLMRIFYYRARLT